MPRRSTQPPPPKTANLTVEEMTRGISRLQKRIADLDAFDFPHGPRPHNSLACNGNWS
jgi:hypothetical protein